MNPHRWEGGRETGFTLIELVLFLVVIAIAIGGILPLFLQVLSGINVFREQVQADFLAREILEEIQAQQFRGGGFSAITVAAYEGDEVIDIGAEVLFNRNVDLMGASLSGSAITCTGSDPAGESYLCVKVTVTNLENSEHLAQSQTVLSRF
ncbi:MAG: type II secretion system protein [Magnetococcales bacterium]|nr:type II secretion system protein [Magnetococcales bacterium]